MTILALEFSSPQRSVAVIAGRPGAVPSVMSEVIETGAGRTMAFEMIQAALAAAGREREQIDQVAIGLGPGSYTGIRVALSVAQGWQLAGPERLKLQGISSAECLAAEAHAAGLRGRTSVVIDAQRDEIYLATYDVSAAGWGEVEPLQIVSRAAGETRAAGSMMVGPEITRWFSNGQTLFPRASRLGQLAWRRTNFIAGNRLSPIYLRETNFAKVGSKPAE